MYLFQTVIVRSFKCAYAAHDRESSLLSMSGTMHGKIYVDNMERYIYIYILGIKINSRRALCRWVLWARVMGSTHWNTALKYILMTSQKPNYMIACYILWIYTFKLVNRSGQYTRWWSKPLNVLFTSK